MALFNVYLVVHPRNRKWVVHPALVRPIHQGSKLLTTANLRMTEERGPPDPQNHLAIRWCQSHNSSQTTCLNVNIYSTDLSIDLSIYLSIYLSYVILCYLILSFLIYLCSTGFKPSAKNLSASRWNSTSAKQPPSLPREILGSSSEVW